MEFRFWQYSFTTLMMESYQKLEFSFNNIVETWQHFYMLFLSIHDPICPKFLMLDKNPHHNVPMLSYGKRAAY